jgi:thiamine-phosphate pyrophosphorylase
MNNYSKFIAVTNHNIQKKPALSLEFIPGNDWYNNFLTQIEYIASLHVTSIVLREKDLSEEIYYQLAKDVIDIGKKNDTKIILHSFIDVALELGYPYIHLPLGMLSDSRNADKLKEFKLIGTSIHSLEDVAAAEKCGTDYLFAGNIYETDCKKGLAGRGLEFLQKVCNKTSLPVYAIGGINTERLDDVINAGAKGGCMMSGFMLK